MYSVRCISTNGKGSPCRVGGGTGPRTGLKGGGGGGPKPQVKVVDYVAGSTTLQLNEKANAAVQDGVGQINVEFDEA